MTTVNMFGSEESFRLMKKEMDDRPGHFLPEGYIYESSIGSAVFDFLVSLCEDHTAVIPQDDDGDLEYEICMILDSCCDYYDLDYEIQG